MSLRAFRPAHADSRLSIVEALREALREAEKRDGDVYQASIGDVIHAINSAQYTKDIRTECRNGRIVEFKFPIYLRIRVD